MGYEKELDTLRQWIDASENIVFFGGAGVSTESGIPDFRSTDGLYNMKYKYPPERILSHSFFMNSRTIGEFYEFYRDKMLYPEAQPNPAHVKLAEWERQGKLKAVVTQNIDGLHQKAGSEHVLELHGSVLRNYCMNCRKFFSLDEMMAFDGVPHCDCGGVIKPDVVLYEEGLDDRVLRESILRIHEADIVIVGGTSLNVYPAAGLLDYYEGNKLVLVNKTATPKDHMADLIIHGSIGEVFSRL